MDFHSPFSDDSAHNTATTFEHIKKFIHWMYKNYLHIKDGIIYDTIDLCRNKYICANAIWLLSVLVFTYRVIIDRCINYPVCGRRNIDGINVPDNSYLRQKCAI